MTVVAARAAALAAELGAPGVETPAPAAVEPTTSSPTAGAAEAPLLRCDGDYWTVAWQESRFLVKDSKGLRYLADLLAAPETEFHALDLVGGATAERPAAAAAREAGLEVRAGGGDAGPLLDDEAKRAYKERVVDLRQELEEAESFNDPERVASAREEIELLTRELAGAVGLGGRDRKVSSSSERARVNVTRAIRSAVEKVAANDPRLGHHLRADVKTGTFCSYAPEPGTPPWTVRGPD